MSPVEMPVDRREASGTSLNRDDYEMEGPLSAGQESLWLAQKLEPESSDYDLVFVARISDGVDEEWLRHALHDQVATHAILRTAYDERDGVPYQRVRRSADPEFALVECGLWEPADYQKWCEREFNRPFDLSKYCVRFFLLRDCPYRPEATADLFVVIVHHIAADIWSLGVFVAGLNRAYRAHRRSMPVEDGVRRSYLDFVRDEHAMLEGDRGESLRDYWKEHLSGAPRSNDLPLERPRRVGRGPHSTFQIVLSRELSDAVRGTARSLSSTPFHVLFSALYACMHRWSRQTDIVVGTPVSVRTRQYKNVCGYFANWLPVRVQFDGEASFSDLLSLVKRAVTDGKHHAQLPFRHIAAQLKHQSTLAPFFQVSFAWERIRGEEDGGDEPSLIRENVLLEQVGSETDLTVICVDDKSSLVVHWNYYVDGFEASAAHRMAEHFRTLLEAVVTRPGASVATLPMMSQPERAQVEAFNEEPPAYPGELCVQGFEEQAKRSPDAVAVVHEGRQLSYGELNDRANQLAHYLRELGVGPDNRVAICAERGFDMIVALLAVLKAGGAYVPLDAAYPIERLRYVLEDSGSAVLLTQGNLASLFTGAGEGLQVVDLMAEAAPWATRPRTDPDRGRVGVTPEHLAYVIYTSGSTGMPKGCGITRANLSGYLAAVLNAYDFDRGDFALYTTLAFDFTATPIFCALLRGRTLQVFAENHDVIEVLRRCFSTGSSVDAIKMTPAHIALLGALALDSTRISSVIVGGEELRADHVAALRALNPSMRIYNEYGPTEATVGSIVHEIPLSWQDTGHAIPIGRPIANTRIYILDAHGQAVPIGVTGEIHIGGAGVARGYLNRPELTAERFVADPFWGEPAARMYKTGDLGRWLPDGNIEFLGRNDFQVKLRGFRIELGEIEARLAEIPGVRDAVVLVREDSPGDKRLVAYYTASEGEDGVGAEALRTHLSRILPEYMVPAAYVRLERLPLTPNGKLDRKALPAPEGDAYLAHGYEAPEGDLETLLAEIWADVLKVERVGRYDNFFELGGHSLLTVQVISRLRQTLGVEVALGELFARPVLADFARGLETVAQSEMPAITRAERNERLALSFAQQRLWFLAQLEGASEAYHVPAGLRLKGELDRDALRKALERIVARHEALRTTFTQEDGEPEQRIAPAGERRFPLIEHDLRGQAGAEEELARLMAEEASAPFSLETGPLIRGRLIRQSEDEHTLLITMHHIVSDGWSIGVLVDEVRALYGAYREGKEDPLEELTTQYADYAAWQRRWIDGEILKKQADYWKETLAGVPELLDVPRDHARPAQQGYRGEVVGFALDARVTAGLKELSRRHGTTLFMTLLSGWAALLGRLSGQDDLVIGTPTANRGHAEIEGLIGFFVNTLALRIDVSGSPTVGELLERVKRQALAGQHHQDIPFEQVVEVTRPERSLAHSPLFQVMFVWQNAPQGTLELPGLELEPMAAPHRTTKFDLLLSLEEAGESIAGALEYATSLFERATIERYVGYLQTLLEAMVADETQAVDRLPLLAETERRLVLEEWNATAAEVPEASVHELFEAQVLRAPDAIAVVHDQQMLTYEQLNRRANQLAHHLRRLAVATGDRVAVLMPRSPDLIVAELAILKSGGAYVPIDPSFPADRIALMIADSGANVVLERIPDIEGPDDNLEIPIDCEAPAYVMYTSGSTGNPKGVVIPHRAVVNLATNDAYARFTAGDRVAFAANPAFDATTMEVWAPLLNGGRVVVIDQEVLFEPRRFGEALTNQGVNVLWLSVGLFNQYADELREEIGRLRHLIVGGDALDPRTIARVLATNPPQHLVNGYGPTETTTFAITHEIRAVEEGARSIPLGRPIANARIYILDRYGEPVPVGVGGEIHVGGAGVGLGYLNEPRLTAERFVSDPFETRAHARMYKTGDFGRWLPDGTVDFLGRHDSQVKVRGFRIELGEIEARLGEHPAVREAVVLVREYAPGDKRLVAYYTLGERGVEWEDAVAADAFRQHLSGSLPEYMVPAAYVRLESLPLTPNGKLDRRALPAPEGDAYAVRRYEAPEGETETTLAGIWSDVLKVERVGRHDNFFELGGHSLLVTKLVIQIKEDIGVEISVRDVFLRPVLSSLAETIIEAQLAQFDPGELTDLVKLMRD